MDIGTDEEPANSPILDRMNRILKRKLLVAGMVFAALPFIFGQPKQAPFSLDISAVKSSVKAGSDVWIKVTMTNISNHSVDCSSAYVNGIDRRLRYNIRDGKGNSTEKHSEHPETIPGSILMCNLDPGSHITNESRISWLHDLSHPGQYEVQVFRDASDLPSDGLVKSNKINIVITQ